MSQHAKSRRRQLRSEESRRDILDAAIRLIARRGITGVTMRDVAEEAKISDGSVFFHFGSREGLLLAVATDLQTKGDAEVEAVVTDATLDSLGKIVTLIDLVLGWVKTDPDRLRIADIFSLERSSLPAIVEYVASVYHPSRDRFSRPFREATAQGMIAEIDIPLFLDYLFASVQGAVLHLEAYKGYRDTGAFLALIRRGLLGMLGLPPDLRPTPITHENAALLNFAT